MRITRKLRFREASLGLAAVCLAIAVGLAGCASEPKGFDPNATGTQMLVEPECVRLGVAKLTKTPIVFKGRGFQPGDSVFINLIGVKKGGKVVDVPIADGNVDKYGRFTAKVGIIVKVSEMLRAKLGSNKKMETVIIVSQPPMPKGVYTARAVSMESDKKAECKLTVKGPSLGDRLTDWLGGLLGKIKKKK